MGRKAIIIGGTGQIGIAVARNFVDRGWEVVALHRGNRALPPDLAQRGVKIRIVDRDARGDLESLLKDGADAVIDTVAYNSDHAMQLASCAKDIGSLVVISSASVYADDAGRSLDEADKSGFPELPVPIPETQRTVEPGVDTYSTRKVAMEQTLLEKACCSVTLLRPAAVHGPGSTHPREWWFVKRALDGRAIVPVRNMHGRFHTSSVNNLAELARVAVESPGKRVLNAADPEALSVSEIGACIAGHFGVQWRLVEIPHMSRPESVGANPWSVPLPFVLDMRVAAEMGYRPAVSYSQTTRETCEWLVDASRRRDWRAAFPVFKKYSFDPFDYETEDKFLARFLRRPGKLIGDIDVTSC
jgi:nucleoside-diphosphate-sugar epimerase